VILNCCHRREREACKESSESSIRTTANVVVSVQQLQLDLRVELKDIEALAGCGKRNFLAKNSEIDHYAEHRINDLRRSVTAI